MENYEIVSWIRKALRADYYMEFNVNLEGKSKKTEGYASDMIFANVIVSDEDKKRQTMDLAIKFGKKTLRKIPLFRDLYIKEIFFYSELLELFRDHQSEQNIIEPFDAVPKCLATYFDDKIDIIFLENLTKRGFLLHPRQSTMNLHHIKILLKNFAKFHALSFSLKEHRSEVFQKIVKHKFISKSNLLSFFPTFFENNAGKILRHLEEANREDLSQKFDHLVKQGIEGRLVEIIEDDVKQAVIIHSDCHTNNFMFQYKDENKEYPIDVAILDWQLARYHSPAIDLSYLLYSVSSKKELSDHTNLLKFYHEELMEYLTKLGNDATSIFSFNDLIDHWKKYAFYGFVYAASFMEWNYVKDDDASSLDNLDRTNTISDNFLINVSEDNLSVCRERLIGIVEHFFSTIKNV